MQVGGPPHAALRRAAKNGDQPARMDRALIRRVWTFARPYRRRLLLFLVTVTAGALLALAPPLLFKQIIDEAIPNRDRGLVKTPSDWPVPGLISHTSAPTPDGWYVADVWESEEAFRRFSEVVLPLLREAGFVAFKELLVTAKVIFFIFN